MDKSKSSVSTTHGVLLVVCAGLCWGTSGTLQAFAPAGATPMTVGAARAVGSGLILLAVTLAVNPQRFFSGRWRPFPVSLAGFGIALYQLTFFAAARMTGAGIAAIIAIGSAPAMAGLMERLFFRERLGLRWYLSTALAVFGGALLVSGGDALTGSTDPAGVLLALVAGLAYAIEGIGIRMIGHERESLDVSTAIFLVSGLLASPFLFTPDAAWILTGRGLLIVLLLAGVSSALALVLFAKGLLIVGVAKAYTFALTEPLTACLLSVFLLGQGLSPIGVVGIAIVCGAILLLATEIKDGA